MDPFTVTTGLTALIATAVGWRMRCRARRAEAQVAELRGELHAERHAAHHDPLTGLPNRRAFYHIGPSLLADRDRHPLIAVLVDLDDFKLVNDRYGHAAGDAVLVAVARRLAVCAGENLVARLGGDEFAGLLTSPSLDRGWLDRFTGRLAQTLAEPIPVNGTRLRVTASVGLVPVPCQLQLTEALRRADAAMYRAKLAGQRVGVRTAVVEAPPAGDAATTAAAGSAELHRPPNELTAVYDRGPVPGPRPGAEVAAAPGTAAPVGY